MIAKSLIAAAAVAVSLTALAPVQEAQAKTNFNIDVGIGLGGGGYYPGYGYGGGYGGGYYPVYEPYYGGISCHKGKNIVKWSGFHNVNAFDCSKPVYQYMAWKNGHKYKVKVGMNGNIFGVKKVF
ncbi:MAG: hypothetical protein Q8L53_08340 [Aestuariivirga sp.]|nr:hypothetical protein [Aestuariivirga sp.]